MIRPKINEKNELKTISEHRFEKLFCATAGFDPMKVPQEHDYGIDYIVRLIDKDKNVLSDCFVSQLKATSKIKEKEKTIKLSNFPVKTLNLLKEEALPAYIFLYNHAKGEMYYSKIDEVCDLLNKKNDNWKNQKDATIFLSCKNLVTEETINTIYEETKRICEQINHKKFILEIASILQKYANIDVKFSKKEQNITIHSAKKGFGVSLKLPLDDAKKIKESFTLGKAFTFDLKDAQMQYTFNDKPIYGLKDIVKIKINPKKKKIKIKFKIQDNNYETEILAITVKQIGSDLIGVTERKSLPWFFSFRLNKNTKKTECKLKFYYEFSNNKQFLKYLEFLKSLEISKKCEMIALSSEKTILNLFFEAPPKVQNWLLEFIKNVNCIEKYTNKKFDLTSQITDEDIEQAYIYRKLIMEGRCDLDTGKLRVNILGEGIKNQINQLLSEDKLTIKHSYEGCICNEKISYHYELCMEDASLSDESKKLLENPKKIENGKEYELEYVSSSKVYLIHRNQSIRGAK